MALFVHKYGGSSLGDAALIQALARAIADKMAAGEQIIVVLSAMLGETNRLLALAEHVAGCQSGPALDALLATGEQVSCALMSMALKQCGVASRVFHGWQLPIITNNDPQCARIRSIGTASLHAALKAGEVPVVTGFQGVTEDQVITTLGRGGSDLTAVAIAHAMQADACRIFSDVKGVYTADPRLIDQAKMHDYLTHEAMLEMAASGSQVLQDRSVELAAQHQVTVCLGESSTHDMGTRLGSDTIENMSLAGVSCDRAYVVYRLEAYQHTLGCLSDLYDQLARVGLDIDSFVQQVSPDNQTTSVSLAMSQEDHVAALSCLHAWSNAVACQETWHIQQHVGKLTLIGMGLRHQPGVAATLMRCLAQHGISVYMMLSSSLKISIMMPEESMVEAAQLIHEKFAGIKHEPIFMGA